MMTHRTVSVRSRLAAGAAAVALAASACGSDGGGTASGTSESWCALAAESELIDDVFSSLGSDPSATESGLKQVETFVKRLPSEAPPEIADDVKVLADGTQKLIDAFAAADFNIADADLAFMADSDLEDKLDAASDKVDAYTLKECGQTFGEAAGSDAGDDADTGDESDTSDESDSGDDGDFDPANGTLRDQLITQFESIGLTTEESTCIAGNLDFADPAVQSGDIGSMLSVFEECGIGLDRLAELGGG